MTIRAKHGRAGSASNAIACDVAWRDAALTRLAATSISAEAIDLSARLLDADPLDEAALRAHMSWLARGGQSARARQAYHDFVKRLADDLGLTPGAELRALHDSLGTAVRSSAASGVSALHPKSMMTSSAAQSNCAGSGNCWRKTTAG